MRTMKSVVMIMRRLILLNGIVFSSLVYDMAANTIDDVLMALKNSNDTDIPHDVLDNVTRGSSHSPGVASAGNSVTFHLYTHNTGPELMESNTKITMTNAHFNPCAETIIIITGWNQPKNSPLIIAFAELAAARFYNVIVVNYNTGSYIREVPYTVKSTVEFLQSLEKHSGANSNRITLIGMSLGANIAGQVGSKHKIGRIIGIDPSGPVYDWRSSIHRLDRSDADFVDVIHTSNVLGTFRKNIGHVNYIINGGSRQPHCGGFEFLCHHVRGIYLFLASITMCDIKFQRCSSYLAFKLGLCKSRPSIDFGLAVNVTEVQKTNGLYFYDTPKAEFPYCGG